MARGKEIKITSSQEYNVVTGTVDNKTPKSIYIQISAWGEPKNYLECDYERILRNKSKRVKNKLFDLITDDLFYKTKTIVDFNMASSGINPNKRSFMSVELTLFKKEPFLPINSKELIPIVEELSEKIISDVFQKDEHFVFHRTKQ